jgi:flavin reductase (DIM6/NTAB) family NADH-FMN oxidoreductase RutF
MSVDEKQFRNVMGHFASGVTVVTTEHRDKPYGMTVASFASLSLRPPLALICIERAIRTHAAIDDSGKFAVNILEESQEAISALFASRADDKFAQVPFSRGALGLPLLEGTLASLECNVTHRLPGGDHTIFVGEIVTATAREGRPLLYFRGGYHGLTGVGG